MATTSPDSLYSPSGPEAYNIPVATGAMQDSVQTALNTIRSEMSSLGTYRVGTNAQRLAISGAGLFPGLVFYCTDTKLEWTYTSAWFLTPRELAYSESSPGTVISTTSTAISGLSLASIPTGVPLIATVSVIATNGQSGGNRTITLRAYNGATAVGVDRPFRLPDGTSTSPYTCQFDIRVANPTNPAWTVQARADQNSSVILSQATLSVRPAPLAL